MLEKRKWCYVQPPSSYGIAPCACGNHETQWSEYARHLWCARCEVDFVPVHGGIFDGPIPVTVCGLLGMSFDRVNLETNKIETFEVPDGL